MPGHGCSYAFYVGPSSSGRRSAARRPNKRLWRMGVRVLVAEDEALIALSLADLLEAEGHEVVLAPDGADALDAARRLGDALGVLVTDLNMPRMGGEAGGGGGGGPPGRGAGGGGAPGGGAAPPPGRGAPPPVRGRGSGRRRGR